MGRRSRILLDHRARDRTFLAPLEKPTRIIRIKNGRTRINQNGGRANARRRRFNFVMCCSDVVRSCSSSSLLFVSKSLMPAIPERLTWRRPPLDPHQSEFTGEIPVEMLVL
jgi:hypothetical protein